MSQILDRSGQQSNRNTSGKSVSIRDNNILDQANESSLIEIFESYNLNISAQNAVVCCPFGYKHSNGQDSNPSFKFYPKNNSFWCFGCKTGNKPCNFVAAMEKINVFEAANIIISKSYSSCDLQNHNYFLDIHIEFANFIRKTIENNPDDLEIIEESCRAFDQFSQQYSHVNESIQRLFLEKIKNKLNQNLISGSV